MALKSNLRQTSPLAVAFFILVACSEEPPYPYHEDLGDEWPLTVTGGRLGCDRYDGKAVYYHYEGDRYALNGAATSKMKRDRRSIYVPLEPIWKIDTESTEKMNKGIPKADWWVVRKSLSELISLGLRLCD